METFRLFFPKRSVHVWLVIPWILLYSMISVSAQPAGELEWEYFGPEQGMGMTFQDILQDGQGFIWLGTTNGLYRYDGYRIQPFKKYSNQAARLSSDAIQDLEEDAQGNIWIATYGGGLSKWERAAGRIVHFRHDPADPNSLRSDNVYKILVDRSGDVWAVVKRPDNVPVLDRLDRATGQVVHYSHAAGQSGSLSCDTISVAAFPAMQLEPLYLDPDGRVWVATANGLNRYHRATNNFQRFLHEEENPHSLSFKKVLSVRASPKEQDVYWVHSASANLERVVLDRLDGKTGRVQQMPLAEGDGGYGLGIFWSKGQEVVWRSDRGLIQSPGADPFGDGKQLELDGMADQTNLRFGIFGHSTGHLLLPMLGASPLRPLRGSDERLVPNGLLYVDGEDGRSVFFRQNPTDPSLPFGEVYAIMEDRSGIIWIGAGRGFYKLSIPDRLRPVKPVFETYHLAKDGEPGLISTDIRSIWEETSSVFWLGTQGGGLARLDRRTGQVAHFRHASADPHSLGSDQVYALWHDAPRNRLWIGHQEGIDMLDLGSVVPERPSAARFRHLSPRSGRLHDRINEIKPAGGGKLWIGTTYHGLLLFDPATEEVVSAVTFDANNPDTAHSAFINKIFVDASGQTWAAPGMGGLCRLTPAADGFEYKCFLDGMFIVDFFEADDGWLWCAAMNYGIVRFDPLTGRSEVINMENWLKRNSVMGIEQDGQGRIWFTSIGLTRYDPVKGTYKSYGREAGVIGFDPERCFFKSSSGELFYSAPHSALQIFQPDMVVDHPHPPQVVLTEFRLFNERVEVGNQSPLKENIEVASEIQLAHDQHSFSFSFAGLEYTNPENNQYRYRLQGVDRDWVYAGTNREARYTEVRPGTYVFEAHAANGDGVWSPQPARLQVVIAKPWWGRGWAYALFAFLLFTPVFLLYRYEVRRKVAVAEARRLKEMDELKTRLYTNITHEFRTPLTVIIGMAEKVVQKPERWFREGMDMIMRNGEQLLTLVNQLLALRKIESGAMTIHKKLGDVLPYLRYIMESVHSLAEHKDIRLHFETELEELYMDYEENSLLRILSNLLSNAIKFTPNGGEVYVAATRVRILAQDWLEIRVRDNGIGIPLEQQTRIFERFYQVDDSSTRRGEGTGIGLALTRGLVLLLDGEIAVQSPAPGMGGRGSEFRVRLPITREAPVKRKEEEEIPGEPDGKRRPYEEWAGVTDGQDKPLALIIEDNPDVVRYLGACLEQDYGLLVAYDGRTGIELAVEHIPDVIISDVMMPEKDGFEVTETLKNDERTSHIPILLLTARTTLEDRITGLERGADAYLEKPFNPQELLVRMEKVIELRDRLRARYAGLSLEPPAPESSLQKEDEFVHKVRRLVEDHLDDPDFSAASVPEEIFLSKTQVHRKLKALTGQSTSQFIRTIRMQHALRLVKTTTRPVTEIALTVGYRDAAYFTRVFSAEFGQAPSDMRQA